MRRSGSASSSKASLPVPSSHGGRRSTTSTGSSPAQLAVIEDVGSSSSRDDGGMRFTSRLLLAVVLAVAALGGLLAVAAAPAHAIEAGRCGKWAATNGSDANDGSQARPYRSLNRLVQSLGPGGVGCIAGGTTYSATEGYGIVRSGGGTAASPVTITSGGSGRARIYGQIDIQAPTHDIVFTDLDFIGTHTDA